MSIIIPPIVPIIDTGFFSIPGLLPPTRITFNLPFSLTIVTRFGFPPFIFEPFRFEATEPSLLEFNADPFNNTLENGTLLQVGTDRNELLTAPLVFDLSIPGWTIDIQEQVPTLFQLAGGGDDILSGGIIQLGGEGNDLFVNGFIIDGGPGNDTLELSGDRDFRLHDEVVFDDLFLPTTFIANIEQAKLFGGNSSNLLDASGFTRGAVTLKGGGGDDFLQGTDFEDTLEGEGGNDNIYGGSGNDYLTASSGDDYLNGGPGDDDIWADEVTTTGGNDTLQGGLGDDFLYGGTGIDTVLEVADVNFTLSNEWLNGLGNDNLFNDHIEQADLTGGASNNRIDASSFTLGAVTLSGEGGDDTLLGGSGNDVISGGSDNDELKGNEGNDTLTGAGGGQDVMVGDEGEDVFALGNGTEVFYDDSLLFTLGTDDFALIADFSAAEDMIQLTDLIPLGGFYSLQTEFTFGSVTGTGIFSNQLFGLSQDLLALVQGETDADRIEASFSFV